MTESLSDKIVNPKAWRSHLDVEDVKEFIKIIEEIVMRRCRGTSANCWEINKEIREEAGEKLI